MTDDELTGIFDNLTPEDFMGSPSGTPAESGAKDFDAFVESNIEAIKIAYMASGGVIDPIAILATPTTRWTYVPESHETMGDYLARLQEEAHKLGASWFFIVRKTIVGSYAAQVGDTVPDSNDSVAVQRMIEQGLASEGIFFFAQRAQDGENEARHGILKVSGPRVVDRVDGNSEHQTTNLFRILD